MKKSNIMEEIENRLGLLEKEAKKGKKKPQVDEEVCPSCGNDLVYVEEGIVYCEKCKEYYENEEEEE